VLGADMGGAAGLLGVGGGEFRIPVLLHVLRLPVKLAAGANTVIGLGVVTLSLARRWGQMRWTADDLAVGGVMAVASVFGATVGARQAHRVSSPWLRRIISVYLIVVGAWMIFEALAHAETILLRPTGPTRWALAGLVGFAVAAASGALGVAGGEMRIPALMYLFGAPVKEAGTISLLASIPTVAAGAFAYRRLGHIPNRVLVLALLMGAGSLAGVLAGSALLPDVDRHAIKAILGGVLLLATAGLAVPGFLEWRKARMGRFVEVCGVDDVAEGKGLAIEVDGLGIAVFRDGGKYHALLGRCPHADAVMGRGWVDDGEAVCPIHQWRFKLSTGRCTTMPGRSLHKFRCKVVEGRVWVEV